MHIVILQLKRIGDLILTTPVLHMLREAKPHVKITLVAMDCCEPLLDAIAADRTLVFRHPFGGANFWQSFLSQHYDICLDFTGNDRSALLTALSRARQRLTYQRFQKRFLRKLIYTEFVDSSVSNKHTVDHHLDLLAPLDIKAQGLTPFLSLSDKSRRYVHHWLGTQNVPNPFVVVHPGTARKEKYWLPERWSKVIVHLNQLGYHVIITGSSSPEEQAHRNAIKHALSKIPHPALRIPHLTDCLGTFSLVELAVLLEKAALLCSVDSAPVHLADAVGTPIIALFGPTNPFHWRPRSAKATIVQPTNAASMSPNTSGGHMADIPTAAVCQAITLLIGQDEKHL